MMRLVLLMPLAAAALLGSCSSEPVRPYEWWLTHQEAAKAKAKVCSEMAEAQAAADVNCARARKAVGAIQDTGPQKWHSAAE